MERGKVGWTEEKPSTKMTMPSSSTALLSSPSLLNKQVNCIISTGVVPKILNG